MTSRQADVLTAIVELHRERRPVTVRALARVLGLTSTTAVRGHLAALERQDVLSWAAGRAGTLHVLRPYRVDLAGRVTPGTVMELPRAGDGPQFGDIRQAASFEPKARHHS